MAMKKFKAGMKVYDCWWPWRVGQVTWVGKTRLRVAFSPYTADTVYDKAHYQFLEIVKEVRK